MYQKWEHIDYNETVDGLKQSKKQEGKINLKLSHNGSGLEKDSVQRQTAPNEQPLFNELN